MFLPPADRRDPQQSLHPQSRTHGARSELHFRRQPAAVGRNLLLCPCDPGGRSDGVVVADLGGALNISCYNRFMEFKLLRLSAVICWVLPYKPSVVDNNP